MKNNISRFLVGLLVLNMAITNIDVVYAAEVGQPIIVSTSPENGASDVSPINLEIRVNFDRNMDTATLKSANVAVTGTLASGAAVNSDIKKNVIFDIANPTYVRVILYGIRMSLGTHLNAKFTGLKSAGGVIKDTFDVAFTITNNFPAPYVNQINNPGFEDNQQVVAGNASTYDTTLVHSGTNALKVVQGAANGTVTFPAYYQPNKKYYYSAWVRLDPSTMAGDTTTIYVNPTYKYNTGTAATPVWSDSNNLVGVTGMTKDSPYTQIKGIFTPPVTKLTDMNNPGQLQNMRFNLYANPITGGTQLFTYYVDDLELMEFENLSVVTTIPASGATEIPVSTRELKFDFNNDMDEASLIGNIKLNDSTSLIQGAVVNPANKKQVIVTLKSDLAMAEQYIVSISGVKDIYTQILSNYEYIFTTVGAVLGKPVITASVPQNNSVGISVNTDLTLTFDSNIDTTTLKPANISEANGKFTVTGVTAVGKRGCVVAYNKPLPQNTEINLVVKNIKNTFGYIMDEQTIKFRTKEADVYPNLISNGEFEIEPTTLSTYNANYQWSSDFKHNGTHSLKVNQTAGWGVVSFVPTSFDATKTYAWSFYGRLAPNNVPGAQAFRFVIGYKTNGTSKSVIISSDTTKYDPSSDFVFFSGTYKIPADQTNITNVSFSSAVDLPEAAGTFYIDDLELMEYNKPAVTLNSVPAPNESLAQISSELKLQFNNNMNVSTISKDSIKINNSNDLIDAVSAVPGSSRTFNITLKQPLEYGKEYTVNIANAKDIYGTTESVVEYKFTTIPKFKFSDCQLLNSDLNPISKIAEGVANVTINDLQSFSPETVHLTLVVCLYKDGSMRDINFKSVAVDGNTTYPGSVCVPITVPNVSDGEYELRVFRVDSFENLQLYYDHAVIFGE